MDIHVQPVSLVDPIIDGSCMAQSAVVARTPSKLIASLTAKGISQQTISANLTITQGDIKDISAVMDTLQTAHGVANIIVCGIGAVFGKNPDFTICQTAARSIFTALAELDPVDPPFFTVISTTGISSGPRDVPIAFLPLYHVLLKKPHQDKVVMEKEVLQAARVGENGKRVIKGYTIVRPSLLVDWKKPAPVLVGTEEGPRVGYTISRETVGKWIFEEVIEERGQRWPSKIVTLTS
ncbi:hypothetical protein MMC19_002577 [Ptychographa xylographoides]|nr:hypothetical protein [Ptychographa xylographoides]